jgi:hypothetical protein
MGGVFSQRLDLHGKPLVVARESLRVLDDQFYDVMLIDSLQGIVASLGFLFQDVVEVPLLHGVMNGQLADELVKDIRLRFRLLEELPQDCVVLGEYSSDIHGSSMCRCSHVVKLRGFC